MSTFNSGVRLSFESSYLSLLISVVSQIRLVVDTTVQEVTVGRDLMPVVGRLPQEREDPVLLETVGAVAVAKQNQNQN
jgi:hypothetical protein